MGRVSTNPSVDGTVSPRKPRRVGLAVELTGEPPTHGGEHRDTVAGAADAVAVGVLGEQPGGFGGVVTARCGGWAYWASSPHQPSHSSVSRAITV
jgi:hypothetical protein